MKEALRCQGPLLAIGVLGGFLIARLIDPWHSPELPVVYAAAASDSAQGLAIATGTITEDADGVFFLDAASGQMSGMVFNPQAGVFNSAFRRNVVADLKLETVKNPRFLLVTGDIQPTQRTATSIAECIIYVVEASSGRFAAYAVPWRRDLYESGRAQVGELALLQTGSTRDILSGK